MELNNGLSGGQRVRLYVDKVKMVFTFSILMHLACVIGFDLCMHNIMPGEFLTRLTWHQVSTRNNAQSSPTERKSKDYEKGLDHRSGTTGMDSGGRLLRSVASEGQAR